MANSQQHKGLTSEKKGLRDGTMNEPISRAVQMCDVCSGKIGPRSCGKEVDEPFETCHGPLPAEQREHLEQSGTAHWPVTATRVAWMSIPALMPCSAAVPRTAASTCGSSKGSVARNVAASASTCEPSPALPKCFSIASASYSTVSERNGRARSTKSVSRFARGRSTSSSRWTQGVGYPHPERRLLKERCDSGRQALRREARDVLAVHPVELLRVEDRIAAADTLERKRRRAHPSTSARDRPRATSRAAPGSSPSLPTRYPWRRYSATDVAPCRLLNRFLSAPRMSGTCANTGVCAPSA